MVFLCYTPEEEETAYWFSQLLESKGIPCRNEPRSPAVPRTGGMQGSVQPHDVMVVFVSNAARKNKGVVQQTRKALFSACVIVPLYLDEERRNTRLDRYLNFYREFGETILPYVDAENAVQRVEQLLRGETPDLEMLETVVRHKLAQKKNAILLWIILFLCAVAMAFCFFLRFLQK